MAPQHDTISALASAPGPAGVAVVRLSGPQAHAILRAVAHLKEAPHARMRLRRLRDRDGRTIDTGYVVAFTAPRTFTGEDVAELHVHGSAAVVARLLDVLGDHGARPALPGEFTRRAFLHGKLDLAQAEALMDLVAAPTEAGREAALAHLDGRLSEALAALREPIVAALAQVEARLDFGDDVDPLPPQTGLHLIAVAERMRALAATARAGRIRHHGVRIALYGAPNAGKSTLFNALVGADRALVHAQPGTTRDVIEARGELDGLPVLWLDAAGMRVTSGEVEAAGVARARQTAATADLLLWLTDGSGPDPRLPDVDGGVDAQVIRLLTKADLPRHPCWSTGAWPAISALRPDDVTRVRALVTAAIQRLVATAHGDIVLARTRHAQALNTAAEAIDRSIVALDARAPLELVAADLRDGADALAEITGEIAPDDVLDAVFGGFCVGK